MPGLRRASFDAVRDTIRVGLLTEVVTVELVDRCVAEAGRADQRVRMLVCRVTVFFVIALCLFSRARAGHSQTAVMRKLVNGLAGPAVWVALPCSSSLSEARQRLGVDPMRRLFRAVAGPLADDHTPGAQVAGFRVVSIDGDVIDVEDTPGNAATYGKPGNGAGTAGYPQLRLVAVSECATTAVMAAVFAPAWGRHGRCEAQLADRLIARGVLGPGMVVALDRLYLSHDRLKTIMASGAHAVCKAKEKIHRLPVLEVLPDGSYLSRVFDPAHAKHLRDKRRRAPAWPDGITVRVVEFTITHQRADGGQTTSERVRLVTTLLDPDQASPAQIIEIYGERWRGSETGYRYLDTLLIGGGQTLRGRTPQLVAQEMYALLIAHQAITHLRVHAAAAAGLDPDRISYTNTIEVAGRHLQNQAARTRQTLTDYRAVACHELTQPDTLNPDRKPRTCPRVLKRRRSSFPVARPADRRPPTTSTTINITGPSAEPPPVPGPRRQPHRERRPAPP